MIFFYAAIIAVIGLSSTVSGVSVVVRNNKVYIDDKPVDMSKLQAVKETDLYKTYVLQSGESSITITKSKIGNALSVHTVGPMTEEEKEKMKKMQEKIGEDVEKNIQQVQENINKFNQELNERINHMNKNLQNLLNFNTFPFF